MAPTTTETDSPVMAPVAKKIYSKVSESFASEHAVKTTNMCIPISEDVINMSLFLRENRQYSTVFDLKVIYNKYARLCDSVVYGPHDVWCYKIARKPISLNDRQIRCVYRFIHDSIEWVNSDEYTKCLSIGEKLNTYREYNWCFYPVVYKMCEFMCFEQDILDYILMCLCYHTERTSDWFRWQSFFHIGFNPDYHFDAYQALYLYSEALSEVSRNRSDAYIDAIRAQEAQDDDDADDRCNDCGSTGCDGYCETLECGCINVCTNECMLQDRDDDDEYGSNWY